MPIVPKIQTVESSPFRPNYQEGRGVSGSAFGADIARANQGFGAAVGNAGDALQQYNITKQREDDEINARDMDNEFSRRRRELLFGESGFYTTKGQATLDSSDKTQAELARIKDEVAGTAKTERARQLYEASATRKLNSDLETVLKHTTDQRLVAADTTSEMRLMEATEDAAAYYNNPAVVNSSAMIVAGEMAEIGRRQGWSKEVVEAKIKERQGVLYSQAVIAAVKHGDIATGRQLLNKYKESIGGVKSAELYAGMKTDVEESAAMAEADKIVAETDDLTAQIEAARRITDPKVREKVLAQLRQRRADTEDIYRLDKLLGTQEQLQLVQSTTDSIMATGADDAQLLEDARSIADPELRKDVEAEVKTRISERKYLQDEKTKQIAQGAFQAVAEGQKVDYWAFENPEEYSELLKYPDIIEGLKKTEAATAEGRIYATSSDGQSMSFFRKMGTHELAGTNPDMYRYTLTKEEYGELSNMVSSAQASLDKNSEDYAVYNTAEGLLKDFAPPFMEWGSAEQSDAQKKAQQEVTNKLNTWIAGQLRQGIKPTYEELMVQAQRMTTPITTSRAGIFNWLLGRDEDGVAGQIDQLTPAQRREIRVPIDVARPSAVEQVKTLFRDRNILPTDDLVEQYLGAFMVNDVARQRRLLGAANSPLSGDPAEDQMNDQYAAQVAKIESGNNPKAKAKTSSATGLFQFVNKTWLDTINQFLPELKEGRTVEQLLALREDPNVSRQVFDAFTRQNAQILKRKGEALTGANLYLAHFLGPGMASKVLSYSDDTMLDEVVGPGAIKANASIMEGKTVGQLRDWAMRKMGNQGPVFQKDESK